jgi:hypothetical protein
VIIGESGPLTFTVALAGVLTTGSLAVKRAKPEGCGTERWSVKTLTDAAAASLDLDLAHAKSTTVEKLRHFTANLVLVVPVAFPAFCDPVATCCGRFRPAGPVWRPIPFPGRAIVAPVRENE